MDARIGTDVAGYRIESLLGRGGMSVVYLAEHVRLGRKVAIKLLSPELAENETFRERFLRESRVAASIDHPNIVTVYDAGDAGDCLYLVMKYVEGIDLATLLRREGVLDPVRTASIICQVAYALDAAHERGLVHRDVKPANVLLGKPSEPSTNEHAYLADFGLAKKTLSVSGVTETGQLVGTVDYVAPEQIRGEPVDGRADVYALGCVLHECLTGQTPYPRERDVAIIWAHVEEPPPVPSSVRRDLPRNLDPVVAQAMAKQVDERIATGGELARQVRAAVGLKPERALLARRPIRRRAHGRRWILVGAASLLVVVATTVLVTRDGGEGAVPGENTVTRIDTSSRSFDKPLKVGRDPIGIAAGEGAVWVVNLTDGTINEIEPLTGEVIPGTAVPGGRPTGVAVGEGAVWVAARFGQELSVLDPRTGDFSAVEVGQGIDAVAVGAGSVWLADGLHGDLIQFDPITRSTEGEPFHVEGDPSFVAVGGEPSYVWVIDSLGEMVVRIDPGTRTLDHFGVSDAPSAIAFGAGSIWITRQEADAVTRLNPDGSTRTTIPVQDACDGPTSIAFGGDGVWVGCRLSGTVIRIDPVADAVTDTLRVHGAPTALTADDNGDVWVTVGRL